MDSRFISYSKYLISFVQDTTMILGAITIPGEVVDLGWAFHLYCLDLDEAVVVGAMKETPVIVFLCGVCLSEPMKMTFEELVHLPYWHTYGWFLEVVITNRMLCISVLFTAATHSCEYNYGIHGSSVWNSEGQFCLKWRSNPCHG